MPVSPEEVRASLGAHLNDVVVAEIIGTGIDAAQLDEVRAWVSADRAHHPEKHARRLPLGPVGRAIDIVERQHQFGENRFGDGGSNLE